MHDVNKIVRGIQFCITCIWIILVFFALTLTAFVNPEIFRETTMDEAPVITSVDPPSPNKQYWSPPDSTLIPSLENGELISYGKQLVSHTAAYLGPKGAVSQTTNGMNCQNCHLKAGTQFLGNNYSAVASTYPKKRARSGTIESIEKRVNDCIERSLNGKALDFESKEMKAFVAYLKWVGSNVPKDSTPEGKGLVELAYLDRAADPKKGAIVFNEFCARCHGENGQGQKLENGIEWRYPPLYGDESYNVGAGLYRVSRFAGYVKSNMPNDLATHDKPVLTDEQAWDVAAFVNSMPRPGKDLSADWPDISKKPVDHPFGPYADSFSEEQHKFGPYKPIAAKK